MADYSKMSKAALLKKYGSSYKKDYGKDEYDFLKNQDTMTIRKIISDIDPEPVRKKDGGSQSTGSFFGDLKKAISSGGSSNITKKVKIMKGDTLGSIAKKHNTTIKMLQDLNSGLKSAEGQKSMQFKGGTFEGESLIVPDPQSFQGGRLKPVRTKKKKDPYEGQTKSDMKEMNKKIMDDKMLKRQQKKVRDTPDRNKKAGGTIKKMNMGGVMKARGGTFKGTY
jgi:hypothetical protein